MTDEDQLILAYCAGVLDSDGTIRVDRVRHNDYRGRGKSYTLYREFLQVGQVETKAVDLLRKTFGGSIYKRKSKKKEHKDIYVWRVIANMAHEAMTVMLPYIRIKKQQAKNMLRLRHVVEASKAANRTQPGKVGTQARPKQFTQAMEFLYTRARDLNGTSLSSRERRILTTSPTLRFKIQPKRPKPKQAPRRKRNSETVKEEIRVRRQEENLSYDNLARIFGVSVGTAWNAVNRGT